MKSTAALKELSRLTSSQWGMVTTAQAARCNISRIQLARLADAGHLERLSHGVYRDTGTPNGPFDTIKAAWLSINPKMTAEERLYSNTHDAVVSGATASHLLRLGDLLPEPYEFTVPTRRQTQRTELRFRTKHLSPSNITLVEGLPVTRVEQTITDLVEASVDLSLVADVLRDAGIIDRELFADLLAPLSARNGFKRNDGAIFRDELERLAHRDAESLAQAIAASPISKRLREILLAGISTEATRQRRDEMRPLPASQALQSMSVSSEKLAEIHKLATLANQ